MQYDGRVNCILMATGLEFPREREAICYFN